MMASGAEHTKFLTNKLLTLVIPKSLDQVGTVILALRLYEEFIT
jgi:hypothetical protein